GEPQRLTLPEHTFSRCFRRYFWLHVNSSQSVTNKRLAFVLRYVKQNIHVLSHHPSLDMPRHSICSPIIWVPASPVWQAAISGLPTDGRRSPNLPSSCSPSLSQRRWVQPVCHEGSKGQAKR